MKKEIIINATSNEIRVALTEDGRLAEVFLEVQDKESRIGSIYLGKVQRVVQGMNAAFIDIGESQHAFLHFSDVGTKLDEFKEFLEDIDSDEDDDELLHDELLANGTAAAGDDDDAAGKKKSAPRKSSRRDDDKRSRDSDRKRGKPDRRKKDADKTATDKTTTDKTTTDEAADAKAEASGDDRAEAESSPRKKSRRRGGRGRGKRRSGERSDQDASGDNDNEQPAAADQSESADAATDGDGQQTQAADGPDGEATRRKRRRRRGGRGRGKRRGEGHDDAENGEANDRPDTDEDSQTEARGRKDAPDERRDSEARSDDAENRDDGERGKPRRRRGGRGRGSRRKEHDGTESRDDSRSSADERPKHEPKPAQDDRSDDAGKKHDKRSTSKAAKTRAKDDDTKAAGDEPKKTRRKSRTPGTPDGEDAGTPGKEDGDSAKKSSKKSSARRGSRGGRGGSSRKKSSDGGSEKSGTSGDSKSSDDDSRSRGANTRDARLPTFQTKRSGEVTIALERGQDVIVQVIRESYSSKGVRVSTKVSLPGRFLVLLPLDPSIGVSRKVQHMKERRRLRRIAQSILPEGHGCIIRTNAQDKDGDVIRQDLMNLINQWRSIEQRLKEVDRPTLLYRDQSVANTVMRDMFTPDINRVVIDSKSLYGDIREYVEWAAPQLADKVELFGGDAPIFDATGIEKEIERIYERRVWLPSGGYIILEQTEALMVIDVNSGRYADSKEQEINSLRTNMEAAREIARQLRLRDIGGLIVVDFIDLYDERNRKKIYDEIKREMRRDRAKSVVLPMTQFGLVQMTRQRIRQQILHTLSEECPTCKGTGLVQSRSAVTRRIDRWLQHFKEDAREFRLTLCAHPDIIEYLTEGGEEVSRLTKMMLKYFVRIKVVPDTTRGYEDFRFYTNRQQTDVTEKYLDK